MKTNPYRINEIFHSLQGEGYWTGTAIVFIRFSGCNLRCPFCDTEFDAYNEMSLDEIVAEVERISEGCGRICVTGGEPSLQIDREFIEAFHRKGYFIHIETNGTKELPDGIDWVTCSPKTDWTPSAGVVLESADELKVVYTGQDVSRWEGFNAAHRFLQPCSGRNTKEVVEFILSHPVWRLSLQTHKYLDIR